MGKQTFITNLGELTVGDLDFIRRNSDQLDAKTFVKDFLQQRGRNKRSKSNWESWPDDKLAAALGEWLVAQEGVDLKEKPQTLISIRDALLQIQDKFSKELKESFNINSTINSLPNWIPPSLLNPIPLQDTINLVSGLLPGSQELFDTTQLTKTIITSALQFPGTTEWAGSEWIKAFSDTFKPMLVPAVPELELPSKRQKLLEELSAELLELPLFELFSIADMLTVTSDIRLDDEITEEINETRKKLTQKMETELRSLLLQIDLDLTHMIDGANFSIENQHADWARHASASLRDMLTQIRKKYAADTDVMLWINDLEYGEGYKYVERLDRHNNPIYKPTQSARVEYILRKVNSQPFRQQLPAAIELTNKAIRFMNEGVHRPNNEIALRQMEAIRLSIFTICRLLITVARLPL